MARRGKNINSSEHNYASYFGLCGDDSTSYNAKTKNRTLTLTFVIFL